MSASFLIASILLTPLIGAVLIALAGRWPNLREAITLITAATLFGLATQMIGPINDREALTLVLAEPLPGLSIAFNVEPLGLMFALLASLLWFVTSIYAFGYMRGNKEPHQTQLLCLLRDRDQWRDGRGHGRQPADPVHFL